MLVYGPRPAYLPEDPGERRALLIELGDMLQIPMTSPDHSSLSKSRAQRTLAGDPDLERGILEILEEGNVFADGLVEFDLGETHGEPGNCSAYGQLVLGDADEADALFEFIRGGGVLSVRTLGEEAAEVIELDVPEGSKYAGKPLGELNLPNGTTVGAVASPGQPAVIPNEQTIVHPGDRVEDLGGVEARREVDDGACNRERMDEDAGEEAEDHPDADIDGSGGDEVRHRTVGQCRFCIARGLHVTQDLSQPTLFQVTENTGNYSGCRR